MSRDWRPIEAVIADEDIFLNHSGQYLHDITPVMTNLNNKDVKIPMYNLEARKPFPNLCYLLNGFEMREYDKIKNDPTAYAFYEKIEKEVGTLADMVRKQVRENKNKISLDEAEVTPTVHKWFLGELDRSFYYNEENNGQFYNWIYEEIRKEKGQEVEEQEIDIEERE